MVKVLRQIYGKWQVGEQSYHGTIFCKRLNSVEMIIQQKLFIKDCLYTGYSGIKTKSKNGSNPLFHFWETQRNSVEHNARYKH